MASVQSARSSDVIVDALNVAYWCGTPPDLRLPLTLMAQLIERQLRVVLFFDASAPHQLVEIDRQIYPELLGHPHVVQVPSGKRADGLMLKAARDSGGRIVSRDRFRAERRRFRRIIDDPARIVSGAVADDVLHVPGLEISAPLPASTRAAWDRIRHR